MQVEVKWPVSVATNDDGSRLAVSGVAGVHDAAIRTPSGAVASSASVVSTWKTNFKAIGYWAAWVAFGAWAVRCDHYYLLNGWWMVLLFFWLTANGVIPAHLVHGRFRLLALGAATVAAAFLIYGTFEWFEEISSGWALGDKWLLVVSLPLRALVASMCTAIALVPQLRRAFGPHSVLLFVIAALPTGIGEYGLDFARWSHWHAQWLSNYIRIFIIIILPLVLAATAER